MAETDPRKVDGGVEEAVVRVLRAEREAREAIDASRAEAQRIAEQARAAARRCAERARERAARGQAAMARRLQEGLSAIDAEARALPEHSEPDARDRARLESAVQTLAAALTGGHVGAATGAPGALAGGTEAR